MWKKNGPCEDMGGTRRTITSLRKLVRCTRLHGMKSSGKGTRQQREYASKEERVWEQSKGKSRGYGRFRITLVIVRALLIGAEGLH